MQKFFITIYFLLTLLPLRAQIFQYIEMENGLSSRRVLSIQQDPQEYMWILTHKGIDRYDGKQFYHYKLQSSKRVMNFYPDLNTLHIDSDSILWEYGKDGYVFRFNALKDSFQLVFDLHDQYPHLKQTPISTVYFDKKDYIWFCCGNNIIRFHTKTKKSQILSENIKENIMGITEAQKGIFYFATNKTIYRITFSDQKTVTKIENVDIGNMRLINYIYYHQNTDKLIISTLMNGLYVYTPHENKICKLENTLKDVGINTIKPYKTPYEVLIATDGDGVYKLNLKTHQLEHFLKEDYEKPNKMNGSIIKDIYIDKAHRIWNVIYPTGITVYSEKYPGYEWIKESRTNQNSLIDDRINAILQDSEGDTWYATSNGISCFDVSEKKWKNYLAPSSKDTPNDNRIFISLCELEPGIIVAGGYMSGTYQINKRTGKVTFSFQPAVTKGETPDKYIRSIHRDQCNTIWSGGFYSLRSYNLQTKESNRYNTAYPITCIKDRDEQSLWIGTINGLYIFDKLKKEFITYDNLPNIGCVNCIYQTNDGSKTYIGTYGNGLFIFDNKQNTHIHYYQDNSGLITNNIYCIIPNKQGNLILGTENGLSQFDTKENLFINWTKEQGLLSANFNQNAAVHTNNGYLIFGSNEGAIILPDSITFPRNFSTHMVFNNLSIMYQTVYPQEKNSPLQKPLNETSTIQLEYNQNTFSFNVSSINYDNPSNILYSWKLEGFYEHWTQPSTNNIIRYTNLSPGNYTLKVRSILLDNNQVLEERSIQIIVERPFWFTFWAFLIYALLLIGIAYGIMRYQIIKRERKTSQEKINFFVHTAHDIRTPLTLIKAPLGEILKNEQLSEQGLVNINLAMQNTDNLSNLANNLMNFQKEELYSSSVIVSKQELNQYLHTYLLQFENYAKQKGLNLQYKSNFEHLDVWIDCNKMDSILRNLLSNALKYTPSGGSVTVEASHTKNNWTVVVTDTGIGIPKQDQKKLFKFLFRGSNATNQLITGSGVGMLLTYRLIKNHEGKISFNSTENVGSSFQLTFPIKSNNYQYKSDSLPQDVSSALLLQENIDPIITEKENSEAPLIMIVEDNNSLRSFLLQSLSAQYRVTGAENGQEAIEKIKKEQPDLILSDVMMPVMSGEELCKIIKSNIETSHIPIILLTALGDREHILRGLETKADMYIVKPFDLTVLKANISNVLENRELIRTRFQQVNPSPSETEAESSLPQLSNLDDEFMNKVTALVKEKMSAELNVDILCAAMNMSRTSFYNKMKALTGIPPADFIRNIRMKEAAILLKSKQYSVTEVAEMVGVSDPKYFTDVFKKFYGVPPSTYMKQNN